MVVLKQKNWLGLVQAVKQWRIKVSDKHKDSITFMVDGKILDKVDSKFDKLFVKRKINAVKILSFKICYTKFRHFKHLNVTKWFWTQKPGSSNFVFYILFLLTTTG
jgi:hypothetical protein